MRNRKMPWWPVVCDQRLDAEWVRIHDLAAQPDFAPAHLLVPPSQLERLAKPKPSSSLPATTKPANYGAIK
ncbi:MAG: hypothetical protein Q7K13_09545 [Polynucleobacter sp.]|uniref:hypothetical protein n=1 Tax=Polynucleobacter sp. TaxID=2029855 RepID=UPI002727948A|nr:hypothetical protein [Polynucleobacter sp.]MDO8714699.1 hypothetical protein [Polynucleobacter sp.]